MEVQDVKDIGAMIKILSEALRQQANRDCREYNLTMQQMRIIHFLKKRENNEVTSQKDIQDFLKISHPTVVNILHLMKNKGFIETSVSPKDKRVKLVRLTGREEGFVTQMIQNRERLERQLVKGLSPKEQNDFLRFLKLAYQNIMETPW